MNSITNNTVIVCRNELHTPTETVSVPLYNSVHRSVLNSVDKFVWNSLSAKVGVSVSLSVTSSIHRKLDEY